MIINSGFSSGGGRKSVTVTATLLASGWTFEAFNDGPVSQYVARQTVNVSGMTAAATAIVSLNSSANAATAKAAAPLMLRAVAQAEGTVTVEASAVTSASSGGDIPIEVDIPIQVTILQEVKNYAFNLYVPVFYGGCFNRL